MPFRQAALGANMDVATLDGLVELTVPSGSQPGTILKMRQRGVQQIGLGGFGGGGRGDQYVHLKVTVPK